VTSRSLLRTKVRSSKGDIARKDRGIRVEFRNSRYEYTTREVNTDPRDVSAKDVDDAMSEFGWHRVWANVTREGTFIVYRRERKS